MNKKIIAIAIATAMAAPVAMADIKVSGRMAGHLTSSDKNVGAGTDTAKASREFGDAGQARLVFDGTDGNFFARIAYDTRAASGGGALAGRDNYLGYNFANSAISFGRIGGAAKNIEKDPYIATFLQMRGTAAISRTSKEYGSSSFVGSIIQYTMKAGGAKVKFQYDPTDNTGASGNEGHTALAVTGKAGAIGYFVSYNNGTGSDGGSSNGQSNTKVGGSMKFGATKVTLMLSGSKASSAAEAQSATFLSADMGLGDGLSANFGYGNNKAKTTWMRLAVAKKFSKQTTVYGGLTNTKPDGGSAGTVMGAGVTVKF